MPRKSVESTDKFLNVRRSTSNINKLLNETKLCHITTRLVCWFLKAYLSSRSHGTGEYPSMHWEERGCTLWIKPTSQDFHISTPWRCWTRWSLHSGMKSKQLHSLLTRQKAYVHSAYQSAESRSVNMSVSRYKPLSRLCASKLCTWTPLWGYH